jgi:hypothetical protein
MADYERVGKWDERKDAIPKEPLQRQKKQRGLLKNLAEQTE